MIDRRYTTALKPGMALGLFFSIFLFMLIVVSLLTTFILSKWGATTPALRIEAVIQDVLMFILPAVLTAVLITRLPAEFLEIMTLPKASTTLMAIAAMLLAIPMMNQVIDWNASWQLPESLAWMKQAEEDAARTVTTMLGQPTVGNLLLSLLIVGVLTGLAEEIFFRGGMQKLLMCTRLNPHAAIWITAIIFSLMHVQIYGFVPRMLLGAIFGYAMWWSGSLWLSVVLHAINNSIVVVNQWCISRGTLSTNIDHIGVEGEWKYVLVGASVVLTAIALWLTYRTTKGQSDTTTNIPSDTNS